MTIDTRQTYKYYLLNVTELPLLRWNAYVHKDSLSFSSLSFPFSPSLFLSSSFSPAHYYIRFRNLYCRGTVLLGKGGKIILLYYCSLPFFSLFTSPSFYLFILFLSGINSRSALLIQPPVLVY